MCVHDQVTGAVVLTRQRLHPRHVPNLAAFCNIRQLNLAHNKLSTIAELSLPSLVALEQLAGER